MEEVTYSNLVTAVRDNIVEIIQDNVTDPISSASYKRKWLYSRTPDTKSRDFSGFPYIVIPSPQISLSNSKTGQHSIDMSKREVTWETEITIHASDRGWANNNGRGLEFVNLISNQLLMNFLDIDLRQQLHDVGMFFSTPEISRVDVIEQNNTLLYEVSVFLSFSVRMRTSKPATVPEFFLTTELGEIITTEAGEDLKLQ